MDKNAIKKYAVWARRELISRVSQRAALYEITADGYGDQNASSVHGRLMSAEEKKQRTALIAQIKEKGYEQVMEEIAYTWFNRFSALRFMEVNGYLPTRIRVFTNDDNAFKPQILDEAINMEMDGLDMQRVYDLKNANDDDALFKYMIITQCNALSSILPGMFQRISDYTELLFPDNLLREGSVVEQMIAMISQEDWTDQVQIIGWLYQYYIGEPKDELINARKQYKVEDIPFVTQLFTSDWIVRFMVENSLGRLWLEGHPNDDLKAGWKYYLEEAEQEPEVRVQLAEIRKEYAALKPEDILAIDPCQGSGHILAYMFDVLVQIYEAYGYSAREAASSIVEHNIWGLDIDERAAQLAYFSVMMKARQYDRRFFSRGIQPHVYVIQESNNLDPHCIEYFVDGRKELKSAMNTLAYEMRDAKLYGSLLNVTVRDFKPLYARFDEIQNEANPSIYTYQAIDVLLPFVRSAEALAKRYHSVVTNPPYLNSSYMPDELKKFIIDNYQNFKNDTFAAFITRALDMCVNNGQIGLLSPYIWLYNSSYAKMRNELNAKFNVTALVQLEYNAFEAACVPVAAFTASKTVVRNNGEYIKLSEFRGIENQAPKTLEAIANPDCNYRFSANQNEFELIPGSPYAFSMDKSLIDLFKGTKVGDYCAQRMRICTGDNNRFLRLWFEVKSQDVLYPNRWVAFSKGGEYRKWYGNWDYVLDYADNGKELKASKGFTGGSDEYYFKPGLVWTDLSSSKISFRDFPAGAIACSAGPMLYADTPEKRYYIAGFLNSKVANEYIKVLCVTLHFQWGDIAKIPLVYDESIVSEVNRLVKENIELSKEEWDSFEFSWHFKRNPLIRNTSLIQNAFCEWEHECEERFLTVKHNEEELNKLFIDLYGLNGKITSEVRDEDVTLRKADRKRDIINLISYAVGCMFGRYSLIEDGVVYAGGNWDQGKYGIYPADSDNIIPICSDEYFDDDITAKFIDFIKVVYGEATLEENLKYIADSIGGNGTARQIIRNYFTNDFFKDHCDIYSIIGSGKRPIYWLFESGKKNGFKCLIYIHRYQADTIARIRTDYVHEQQSRYRTAIADIQNRISNASTGERVKLNKELKMIKEQAEELRSYEEKIHHLADKMIRIDMNDGIKSNYSLFQSVLPRLK